MKRLCLAFAILVAGISAASATCTSPAVMKDNASSTFNMSLATAPDGNCASNNAITTWGGVSLGAASNYGTSPGAVEVPGVNAFVTNTVSVTGTFWPYTLGQQVSGSSVPVVLPAAQITTLTPPTTVTANLGTLNGAATATNQPTNAAQASTTSGQTGPLVQCAVTTSAPSYTTAQTDPFSCDTSGNVRVTVASAIGLAQGSTTSGQTGSLVMGAVTTSAPSYTTAQTSPISLDTAGNVRMNCTTGCGGAGSVSNASSAVATSSTNIGAASWLYGFNGTTWDQLQVDGSKNLKTIVNAALPAGTNLIGKTGIDQTTPGTTNGVQDAATSATGSAPASKAIYTGANGSGNLTGEIVCDSFITYDASTNGSTQLVALSAGKSVYVCGYTITTGATATNVKLIYGTGTACVTSPQPVTPAYQLGVNSGIVDHASNHWSGMKTAASNELCINTSAGNPVQATVYYTQF